MKACFSKLRHLLLQDQKLAASDSLKLQQLMENDPYYKGQENTDMSAHQGMDTSLIGIKYGNNIVSRRSSTISHSTTYNNPNETKVYQKLAQLDDALNKASSPGVNREDNISKVKPIRHTSVQLLKLGMEQVLHRLKLKAFFLIAAWFHDTAYSVRYIEHESASKKIAFNFLTINNYG